MVFVPLSSLCRLERDGKAAFGRIECDLNARGLEKGERQGRQIYQELPEAQEGRIREVAKRVVSGK